MGNHTETPQSVLSHLYRSHLIMKSQVVFIVIFLISGILTKSFLVEVDDKPIEELTTPSVQPEPYGTDGDNAPQPYGDGAPKPYGEKGGDDYFIQHIWNAVQGFLGRK